jgi:hypothetical protein
MSSIHRIEDSCDATETKDNDNNGEEKWIWRVPSMNRWKSLPLKRLSFFLHTKYINSTRFTPHDRNHSRHKEKRPRAEFLLSCTIIETT